MGNEEQAISKAEEILIALGAKPTNQATGDDMPVLQGKSTRKTEDITDLASAEGEGEADGWLNSAPHRQVPPERHPQDTDSLDSYLALPAPSQEQATQEVEDAGTYPDNPFEISLIVPDRDAFEGESLEEQLRYTGSGGYSKAPPMPGLTPSEGLAGLRRRRTDVFTSYPDPASDPALDISGIQPDVPFEQLDRRDNVPAFSQQTTLPDNQPLPSDAQQLKLPTQVPASVRIPPGGARVADDYHLFAVEWTTNQIDFFLDGTKYFTVTRATVEQHGKWVYDHPFYLLLNVAVGGQWPGSPDGSSTYPQKMSVDYVRVYQPK